MGGQLQFWDDGPLHQVFFAVRPDVTAAASIAARAQHELS